MKEHIIKCYRNEKLKLTIRCYIREDIFVNQLKNGVIYYDTSLNGGNFEIINLNMFNGWLLGLWIAEVVIHGIIILSI